jgi:Flp pilus assembly protein TadG
MPSAPRARPRASEPTAPRSRENRGQALVEFAFVLLPILLVIVAVVQFGLLFGASVTLTNAAREAARAATIERYDMSPSSTRATNDIARCNAALDAAKQSFGLLNAASPHFVTTDPCPAGTDLNGDGYGDRWVNGDLTITLCASMATPTSPCPTTGTYCAVDEPTGCLVQVALTYRSDIVVPFMGALLPHDANGRFVQTTVTTMVVN